MISPRKLERPRSFSIRNERGMKRSLSDLPDEDEVIIPVDCTHHDIGAIDALKAVASSPDEVPAKFARFALRIIGEEIPHKLSHQVPLWTIDDVRYWVTKIGFGAYSSKFEEQMVDGDLLLLLTDDELQTDIGMKSGLLRKRFRRELDSLKVAADYSCIDETQMDRVMMSQSPQLSIYTYRLLEMGVDTKNLSLLNDEMLANICGIDNPIHRNKILQVSNVCAHNEDVELAILRKHIDVFISYRRSTGNQLASLIKVLLQLRGHKVFIDVDRLYAGNFDQSLWKNIQAANHFILVLTPSSLDRLLDDHECEDWVHKEIKCALEHGRNVIPVFEQNFQWPDENRLPADIRCITKFNAVRWVHEYQEACVDKLERFIAGELTLPPPGSTTPSNNGGGGSSKNSIAGGSAGPSSPTTTSNGTTTSSSSSSSTMHKSKSSPHSLLNNNNSHNGQQLQLQIVDDNNDQLQHLSPNVFHSPPTTHSTGNKNNNGQHRSASSTNNQQKLEEEHQRSSSTTTTAINGPQQQRQQSPSPPLSPDSSPQQ